MHQTGTRAWPAAAPTCGGGQPPLALDGVRYVVVDEADRLLQMSMREQVEYGIA